MSAPNWRRKLVIGTSRTKYCSPKDVGATVQSHRGEKLADLAATVSRYPSPRMNCVTIVARFNDNSYTVSDFANHWRLLLRLIIHKFNPIVLILPKTILTAKNNLINRKLGALNNSLIHFNTQESELIPSLILVLICFVKMVFIFLFMVLSFQFIARSANLYIFTINLTSSLPNYGQSNALPYLQTPPPKRRHMVCHLQSLHVLCSGLQSRKYYYEGFS